MLIVGELINASRKVIKELMVAKNAEAIVSIAKNQVENNADYIDVNAGVFVDQETDYLKWLVMTVQEFVDVPCCIDSPNPKAIEMALSVHKGKAMINSISLEKKRWENLLPLVAGAGNMVVALCMGDDGMPKTAEQRVKIADELINGLVQNKVPVEDIYVDPLVQPVATDQTFGLEFIMAIERIKLEFPGVHTMCGLSNISFGLPERKSINQTFMVMAITRGLDGAIIDPLDKKMMASIIITEALMGKDLYCSNYLKAYRENKIAS
jgi:5-methyltetrahydrofolate--homocysteine methyltransferase